MRQNRLTDVEFATKLAKAVRRAVNGLAMEGCLASTRSAGIVEVTKGLQAQIFVKASRFSPALLKKDSRTGGLLEEAHRQAAQKRDKRRMAAMRAACRRLIKAYVRGENAHWPADWPAIDVAATMARKALRMR